MTVIERSFIGSKEMPHREILYTRGGYRLEVGQDGKLKVFSNERILPVISDAVGTVDLSDGRRVTTADGDRTLARTDEGGVSMRVKVDDMTLIWNITPDKDLPAFRMSQSVEGDAQVERMTVLEMPTGIEKAPANNVDAADYGYQSWSIAKKGKISELNFTPDNVRKQTLGPSIPTADIMPSFTTLKTASGQDMLIGFTTTKKLHGTVEVEATDQAHRISAWNDAEGKGTTSEELLVLFGQPESRALDIYAEEQLRVRELKPKDKNDMPESDDCSWYEKRHGITEDNIREEAKTLEQLPRIKRITVDDGWQHGPLTGDWMPNDKFLPPELHGLSLHEIMDNPELQDRIDAHMRTLTDALRAKGKAPTLWLAPGVVHQKSEQYQMHPDWVVKDDKGKPLNVLVNKDWDENGNYALDITNPDVQQHIDDLFTRIFDKWGFEGVKIDFLFSLYVKGNREDPSVTSLEAGNMFMERIRHIAKDGRTQEDERSILGCGMPLLPAIGYVDSMRVSPDAHPKWIVLDGLRGEKYNLAMNLQRSGMLEKFYYPVHDPIIFRRDTSELTDEQRETAIVVNALSGGVVSVGEDMSRMQVEDPEQFSYIQDVLDKLGEPTGKAARPVTYDEEGFPQIMQLDIDEGGKTWKVAADINFSSKERSSVLDTVMFDLDPDKQYEVIDTVREIHLGQIYGWDRIELPNLPEGGSHLVVIKEANGKAEDPKTVDYLGRTRT